jgi:hypothetical protein
MSETTETNYSEQIEDLKQRVELLEDRLMNLERRPAQAKPPTISQGPTIRRRKANIPDRPPQRFRTNESGPEIVTSEPAPLITHTEE